MSATEHLLRFPSLLKELSDPPEEDGSCRHGTSLRQGREGVLWLHPFASVGFSHAVKKKWLDLPGRHQGRQQKAVFGKHFLPPDKMLRVYRGGGGFLHRTQQGYLAVWGTQA